MAGAPPPVPRTPPVTPFTTVPFPRRPLVPGGAWERVRWWYENALGWPTAPGSPVRLRTGVRFDVLDVPAEAGHAALGRLGRPGSGAPVAVRGERMLLLVAAGSAEELPGLLDWLEWGSLALDLTAVGAGGLIDAPLPPGADPSGRSGPTGPWALPPDHGGSQGAAVWLRPPEPGREAGTSLPTLSAVGGDGVAPDLVRLVRTLATQCHRVGLRRACGPPPVPSHAPR
ncbi:SCO3374 family protein [Streptomyces sp. NPDC052309]|uniref:SCO3374 family protein n=1 Tax=Streptomyces sp. NPDC052309 TaxID=3155421 RepID=UPI003421D61C